MKKMFKFEMTDKDLIELCLNTIISNKNQMVIGSCNIITGFILLRRRLKFIFKKFKNQHTPRSVIIIEASEVIFFLFVSFKLTKKQQRPTLGFGSSTKYLFYYLCIATICMYCQRFMFKK